MMKDAPSIKSIVPYECDFEFVQKINCEAYASIVD